MNLESCSICQFWNSSIGKKLIVAITGIILVGFLAGHLSGNLLMFMGRDAFDSYAHFLHHFLHGAGVWIARIVLLGSLVLHVAATISLVQQNKAAKAQNYKKETTIQASRSSRLMIWSGVTILSFIVYHILHFTIRFGKTAEIGEISPYKMVIYGFQSPLNVIAYIVAMICLCSHLHHGVASIFQTLGLRTQRNGQLIDSGAKVYCAVIFFGFISVPLSIAFGLIS